MLTALHKAAQGYARKFKHIWHKLSLRFILKSAEVFFCSLISFIETPGHPPLGFPWHVRCAVTLVRLFPDPVAAGGRAHCPTTTAHYSETLQGLRWYGGRWRGGQTRTRASLWHSFPLFSRYPLHPDPLLLCQPSGTLTLPGRLGHSRTKTQLSFQDLVPRKPPCATHSSHSWESDTNSWLIAGFCF